MIKISRSHFYIMCGALSFSFLTVGCATDKHQKLISDLKGRLAAASRSLQAIERENQDLKSEISILKRFEDVDSHRLIDSLPVLKELMAEEIADGDVWIEMRDRGLVIIISAERLFDSASDEISDSGEEFLDKFYEILQQRFASNYLHIEGHTDNQSLAVFEWKSDWDFSFARALGVLRFLTEKKGADTLRFSASGFGQHRPRSTNETKEGRRLNRRIEIIISPRRVEHIQPQES